MALTQAPSKGDVVGFLHAHLKLGDTAVDVGAASGELTRIMAQIVGPTGQVLAFEPNPANADALTACQTVAPWIAVWPMAVGEASTNIAFVVHPNGVGSSRWHGDGENVTVPMVRLDDVIQTADLVKVDTQGSEAHVLDGAALLLKSCPAWVIELWPWGLQTAGRSSHELLDQIRAAGQIPRWMHGQPIEDADVVTWLAAPPKPSRHLNILVDATWP